MFKFVVICALLAAATAQHHSFGNKHNAAAQHNSFVKPHSPSAAVHSGDDANSETLKLESDVHEHGFNYVYETSNNIKGVAEGDASGNVRGSFEWVSPDGQHVQVNYVADENGYQPQSDALPTAHPIPEAILRSLEYIARHPPQQVEHGRKF